MPYHDWQFWVVSLLTLLAVCWVLSRAWKAVRSSAGGKSGKSTQTTLTIEGGKIKK
jgi:hypothetical protein